MQKQVLMHRRCRSRPKPPMVLFGALTPLAFSVHTVHNLSSNQLIYAEY